jgi:hypothetical protein
MQNSSQKSWFSFTRNKFFFFIVDCPAHRKSGFVFPVIDLGIKECNIAAEWLALCFLFWRTRLQISTQRPAVLTELRWLYCSKGSVLLRFLLLKVDVIHQRQFLNCFFVNKRSALAIIRASHLFCNISAAISKTKMIVVWFVASCRLVWVFQRFRGLYCFRLQGEMMEAVGKLIPVYTALQPEDSHLLSHRHENLKS